MTPEQFKDARRAMGYSQQALADEFDMGPNGARTIRRWESGSRPMNKVVAFTVKLMLKGFEFEKAAQEST